MTQRPDHLPPLPATLAGLLARGAAELALRQPPPQLQAAVEQRVRAARMAATAKPLMQLMGLRPNMRELATGFFAAASSAWPPGRHQRSLQPGSANASLPAHFAGGLSMATAAAVILLLAQSAEQPTLLSAVQPSEPGASPPAQFVAVPGNSNLATSPRNSPSNSDALWLAPVTLPRAELARFGLPFDPSEASTPVRAEVLLNAYGQAVGVRVLP